MILSYLQANAQLIPLPPPVSDMIGDNNGERMQTDRHPPHIEVLTTETKTRQECI